MNSLAMFVRGGDVWIKAARSPASFELSTHNNNNNNNKKNKLKNKTITIIIIIFLRTMFARDFLNAIQSNYDRPIVFYLCYF